MNCKKISAIAFATSSLLTPMVIQGQKLYVFMHPRKNFSASAFVFFFESAGLDWWTTSPDPFEKFTGQARRIEKTSPPHPDHTRKFMDQEESFMKKSLSLFLAVLMLAASVPLAGAAPGGDICLNLSCRSRVCLIFSRRLFPVVKFTLLMTK